MCDQHEIPQRVPLLGFSKRRSLVWELPSKLHCALVGTCLTMDETRKIIRQSNARVPDQSSDYTYHATLVGEASEKSRASKSLHKMLDKKYARWIKGIPSGSSSDALEDLWLEAIQSGDIAGPFWAIATHPNASRELLMRCFEDIHMLSHIQGSSNRADIRSANAMKEKLAELREALERLRRTHQASLQERDEKIRGLESTLHEIKLTKERLVPKEEMPAIIDSQKQHQALFKRLEWTESRLREREEEADSAKSEIARLKSLLSDAEDQHDFMEQTLLQLFNQRACESPESPCSLDLCGKRILYVGGRSALVPHLRSLVEACNGCFDHHDGGMEESRAGLKCTLAGADMVFCPIDCISHGACQMVKRFCHQQAKPFVPLKSSGLSSFASGLRAISYSA